MKRYNYILSFVIISLIPQLSHAQTLHGRSFFMPRSQGTNAAHDIAGIHPQLHKYDQQHCYGIIAATPSFHKSVRPNRMAQALFGTDILEISGSQVANRGEQDLLADYFGLSPEFSSTVNIDPVISSFQTAFNMNFHFDKWVPGLYAYFKVPIVWTKWNLRMSERVANDGTGTLFPANYMDENTVVAPGKSFVQSLRGNTTFGDLAEALKYCKVCGSQTKTGVADASALIGYDIISRYHGHFGLNMHIAAPTGSKPKSEFMFEPIVGNGNHWELGLGLDGHVLLWEKDGDQQLNLWTSASLTHLFKSEQHRCFDLQCDRFGSRFILLKEFDTDGNYTGQLFPGPNKLTLSADVKIPAQFEFLFMFGYTNKGFVCDFGYNGWIRSKEKIVLNECLPDRTYALKGIQNVSIAPAVLSNATQSTATVFGNDFADQAVVADTNPPVFISTGHIDLSSAASPMALTHKIFTHIGHTWLDNRLQPFVGIGGEIEFEGINTRENRQPLKNTMAQWGVWLRGGTGF